jgi:hypothetical protein
LLLLSDYIGFGNAQTRSGVVVHLAGHPRQGKVLRLTESRDKSQKRKQARTGGHERTADATQAGESASILPATPPQTGEPSNPDTTRSDLRESVCLMIESAGRAYDLPVEFFARVIWEESRFHPDTVGPRRRNGESAEGIAQFMPATAAERGLLDPFDPVQALPKAAQLLRELKDQFGNLGLAAAAYNAGTARVRSWLAGGRSLPSETRSYVAAVTGVQAREWAKTGSRQPALKKSPNCEELIAALDAPIVPARLHTQLAENGLAASQAGPVRSERGRMEAPANATEPASAESPTMLPSKQLTQSPSMQLATSGLASNEVSAKLPDPPPGNEADPTAVAPMQRTVVVPQQETAFGDDERMQALPSPKESPQVVQEPVASPDIELAENAPVAPPLELARENVPSLPQSVPLAPGDTGKQQASPEADTAFLASHAAELIGKEPVAGPVQAELTSPRAALPSSQDDTGKEPASPAAIPSEDAPVNPGSTRLANSAPDRVDPMRPPSPREEAEPSRGDIANPADTGHGSSNLFIAKLMERVKLTVSSPWGIQLSAGFSRERALEAYARLASQYAEILAGKDASIVSSVLRSRGTQTFYQVRVGTDSFESASNMCAEIRNAGGACMVLRNGS